MFIPETILDNTVVSIAETAFSDNKSITSVVMPNTLNKVSNYAFLRAAKLETAFIPESCKYLGLSAFQDCPSLKTVELNGTFTTIKAQTFLRCSKLESIVLPDTVETIEKLAFSGCDALQCVTIPRTTTSIVANAFSNSPNVTIKGYKDSYAQQFAAENGINFEVIPETPEYEMGDVDLSGTLDIKDATALQRYLAGSATFNELQLTLSDFNSDGKIDVKDVTAIQRHLAQS